MIESGELPAGMRLDNEIDLADQLGFPADDAQGDRLPVDRGLVVRNAASEPRSLTRKCAGRSG